MDRTTFQPNWASNPGDTILDILEEKNWSIEKFAQKMEADTKQVQKLIEGQVEISSKIANQLGNVLGGSAQFWINRNEQYLSDLQHLTKAQASQDENDWLKSLPVNDMLKAKWIKPFSNAKEKLLSCLEYFDVPDVVTWKKKYPDMLAIAAYRTSPTFEPQLGSVAAWVRQGEVRSAAIKCKPWNKEKFKETLIRLRGLTRKKDPESFVPELVKECAECGVAVVIVKTPSGCQASGATKFISKDRAMMLLSFRYLLDDHFWFTFFHEAGHLVLHDRSAMFLEEVRKGRTITEEEKEANRFAADILIPEKLRSSLKSMPINRVSILRFSISAGVSRGIVVGQLQHMNRIGPHQLNGYKRRYTWDKIEKL